MTDRMMHQEAPYPEELAVLVRALSYREHLGWRVVLEDDLQRDKPGRHSGESRGMTLTVVRHGPDTYHPVDTERHLRSLLRVLAEHADGLPEPVTAVAAQARQALGQLLTVRHYFPVPPATYGWQSWQRWLFDQLGKVDDHERMEDFTVAGYRPYAPVHKPGVDPYTVHELTTDEDRRTSFRGTLNPE